MTHKKIKLRLFSIMLTGCMVVSLAACGNKEKATGGEGTAEGERGKIKVTLGRTTTANPKLPQGDTYEDNAYVRWAEEVLNLSITDEFEASGVDYDRKVSLALSSGELPDMMIVPNREVLKEMVDNDLVADLTESWDKYATDTMKDIVNSYDGRVLDKVEFDGRMMAIPSTWPDPGTSEVWIRSDWIQELGIAVDEDQNHTITLDELKMVAKEFLEKNPGKAENPVGISFIPRLFDADPAGSRVMNAIAASLGAYPQTWLNDDGKVTYGSTLAPMKDTLKLAADWYKEGILDPQLGTRKEEDITSLLTNGQTGIILGPWHMPDWLLNNVREMDKKATFEAYAIEGADGKVNTKHINPVGSVVVVRKGFEHPEIAVEIANLFFDTMKYSQESIAKYPDVVKYIESAVDGTARPFNIEMNSATSLLDDYSDIKKGVKDEIKIEEARTIESQNVIRSAKSYLSDPATAVTTDWSRYHSRMKGLELMQSLTEAGTFHYISPIFPLATPTMQTNKANLDKLEEETYIKIVTGAIPVEEGFNQFVAEWNRLGGEQIIKEIEEQIK